MPFVGDDIGEGPFDTLLEGMFADAAVRFCADMAREVGAGVGVDEEFHLFAEAAFDETRQFFHFVVGFEDVEVPGHGEVAIDVEQAAVFDDAEVVEVDPILAPVMIHIIDHLLEQLQIGLVHDAGDAFTEDMITRIEYDPREDDGDEAVEPDQVGEPDRDEADDDANGGVGVGLEMFAPGGEGHGVVVTALCDADGADDEVDDGGEGDDINTLVEFLERMGMDEIDDGLVDDDETRHDDQRALDGGREEFRFAMAVRMIDVAGFGGDVEAIEPDKPGDDIDGAFECVGEYGHTLGKVVGCQLQEKENRGNNGYPALDGDIFP